MSFPILLRLEIIWFLKKQMEKSNSNKLPTLIRSKGRSFERQRAPPKNTHSFRF